MAGICYPDGIHLSAIKNIRYYDFHGENNWHKNCNPDWGISHTGQAILLHR